MEDFIKRVWEYCMGPNNLYGKDAFGNDIKFDEYGQKTKYGWTIDHIWPLNPQKDNYNVGSNSLQNLQVLSIKSNNKKANLINGKINNIVFAVKKIGVDKDEKNIGRMKVKINSVWYWAYNDWKNID